MPHRNTKFCFASISLTPLPSALNFFCCTETRNKIPKATPPIMKSGASNPSFKREPSAKIQILAINEQI